MVVARQAREPRPKGERVAAVLGGTGLVGRALWRQLGEYRPAYWREIVLLVRRPLHEPMPPGVRYEVVDFEQLEQGLSYLRVDDLFCALGTTLAKAGSREAFARVDHDYVVETVAVLKRGGLQQAVIVSAVGANPQSLFFYNRVKGEMERDVVAQHLGNTVFVRPSLLLGARAEARPMERLSIRFLQPLAPLFKGVLGPYRPIPHDRVAAGNDPGGSRLY